MKRLTSLTLLLPFAVCLAYGQSSEAPPKFEAADVHISPKAQNQFVRSGPARNGRYEVKQATMVDLVRMAYGFTADKILGGPNWLEMDRFDVIAKVPADTTPEVQNQMLQTLLQERFKLVVHKETKPLPTYALLAGKSPKLKESSGEGETGCKPQSAPAGPPPSPDAPGGGRMVVMFSSGLSGGGSPTQLVLGPGMTVQYSCHNMTMPGFVSALKTMFGTNLGTNPVQEETGLKGSYNFDIKYSMNLTGAVMMGDNTTRVSIFDAVDKQLGLKLEERPVPTPVIVVDSVNRKPAENPPGTAQALPTVDPPKEFEVASVKFVDAPMGPGMRMMRFGMQPGGRFEAVGMPLSFLLQRAFNTNNNQAVANIPPFANTDRYDINAKVATDGPAITNTDQEALAPLMLALLKDRFKLEFHTEDRPVTAYALVAGKPKLKKADPDSRTHCNTGNPPPGSPPGSRALTCQNVTLDQFAERLQNITPDLNWPVENNTKLEGGYDLQLVFSMGMGMRVGGDGPPPPPLPGSGAMSGMTGGMASASDPVDSLTIFEAMEKQLGLKLEKQKRNAPVFVIDHLEQKPTEN